MGDRDGDDAISPADTLDIRAGDGQRGDHQGGGERLSAAGEW